MKNAKFIIIIVCFLASQRLLSQPFNELTGLTLSGAYNSCVTWGDCNNDGNLDFIVAGRPIASIIYKNQGSGSFANSGASLPVLEHSALAWGDYDNDGDLDLIATGWNSVDGNVTRIYKNNGSYSFVNQTSIVLPKVYDGSVAWGDYDNDGDLDILIAGNSTEGEICKIYKNNGGNNFSDSGILLPGISSGTAAWGDYNNDGYIDILLCGSGITKILRNTGSNSFVDSGNSLIGVTVGAAAWGDYNNDGFLDVAITGFSTKNEARVYKNKGDGTFEEQTSIILQGVQASSVAWGDYDNDGRIDLLVAGTGSEASTKLYHNNGNDTFSDSGVSLLGITVGSVAWADYDNDGDLDIILSGYSTSNFYTKIYRNDIATPNVAPAIPANLTTSKDNNRIKFTWSLSTDNKTPQKAISYNIKIGKTSGGSEIVTPMSSSYGRSVPAIGNCQLNNSYFIADTLPGKYYWSVQAVDNGFKASAFSSESLFTIDSIQSSKLSTRKIDPNTLVVRWKRGNGQRCIVFAKAGESSAVAVPHNTTYYPDNTFGYGDQIGTTGWYCIYNGRGDSLVLNGLQSGTVYTIQVLEYLTTSSSKRYYREVRSDNLGIFGTDLFINQITNLTGISFGAVAWADYNNDGYLDIAYTGGTNVSPSQIGSICRNKGDNTFESTYAINGVYNSRLAWGDYDNDGKLDILQTGLNATSDVETKLYKNTGSSFVTPAEVVLPQFPITQYGGSVSWFDYDNDGFLDILMSSGATKILHNNSGSSFTELTSANIAGTSNGAADWGDYDNDGYLDIIVTGADKSRIFRNNGDATFAEQAGIVIPGVKNGIAKWGDYDKDGYLDFFIAGYTGVTFENVYSSIYHNNGNNTFTQIPVSIQGVANCDAAWGDFNNDGYLDLFITGATQPSNNGAVVKLYFNKGDGSFVEAANLNIVGFTSSSVSCGDYDNDGDLDVLIAGYANGTPSTRLYRNSLFMKAGNYATNQKPQVPQGVISTLSPNTAKLQWFPVAGDESSSKVMSYNIKLGTSNLLEDKCSSASNAAGFRKIVSFGNAQLNNYYIFKNLPQGEYYWSVQAVDQVYQGGAWSTVGSFAIKNTQAFFEADTVCLHFPTHFTSQSVATDGIASFKWYFGDGKTSTSENPTYTYTSSGTFLAKLVITSNSGAKDSLEKNIVVKSLPVTSFTATTVCLGAPTVLTNTTDLNGLTIDSWSWSFGDGQSSSIQQPLSHEYANSGDYAIKLKTIASNGCADSTVKTVTIADYPIAVIAANAPLTICKGDSVTLSVQYNNKYMYTWKVNGTNLADSDSSDYIVKLSGTYQVEVVNTLGGCTSSSSQVSANVLNVPAAPSITYNGALQFCQDESVTLSVTNIGGYKYQWKLNGGAVGDNSYQYIAKDKGRYGLSVTNNEGCSANSVNYIDVDVFAKPAVPVLSLSGSTSFCTGGSVTISAPLIIGNDYRWKNEYGVIDGYTSSSYTAKTTGNYFLEISNAQGCKVVSPEVAVTVNELPEKPTITEATNTTTYCLGTEVELKVTNPLSTLNYQWKRSGLTIDGATQSSYKGKLIAGDYRVEAVKGPCISESDIITLTTKPAPPKPSLYAWGPNVWILVCDNNTAKDYRWYYNKELVIGAKTNQYVAKQNLGNYYVEVSDGGECYSSSDVINIPTGNIISGVEDIPDGAIDVFPNPTTGLVTVSLGGIIPDEISVECVDAFGNILSRSQFHDLNRFTFDLSGYAKGIYFLKVYYKNSLAVKKIIKQ